MEGHMPQLITDLTLILAMAGVVTVLFRKLRQPLVLGYIVVGFLASPYMPYTPSVSDEETISLWSELGVIFLMFSLGLEFSFKKILRGGLSPILTTAFTIAALMTLGASVGHLLGMNSTSCLFLGGMLSVSSTTIVYKAFSDLGLSNKKFASKVISVLILEDIFAIVLMAFFSTLANGDGQSAGNMLLIVARLLFFLVVWFVVGIWLIPTLLRRYAKYITGETLLIISLALCFVMVYIANNIGYGSELGAFVMGSILAETLEAERIEHSIKSVKDLFGAIFFVSVGMMVQPMLVIEHWEMILILVLTVVMGTMTFGTLAFRLFGSSMRDAVRCGFSLVQIGEFSFIIATLGVNTGLIEDYIYPIIVTVSIVTTFITPYSIKLAMSLRFGEDKEGVAAVDAEQNAVISEERSLHPWLQYIRHHLLRICVALFVVYLIWVYGAKLELWLRITISMVAVCFILFSRFTRRMSKEIERTFMFNLTRRDEVMVQEGKEMSYAHKLRGRDLHVTQLHLPDSTKWAGHTLAQLKIARSGVIVTAIVRNCQRVNIPGGNAMLFPGDIIEVAGDDNGIDAIKQRIEAEVIEPSVSSGDVMQIMRSVVSDGSALGGLLIKNSGVRESYQCLVIGLEEEDGTLSNVSPDHCISNGDKLWLAGEHTNLVRLNNVLTKA